MDDVCSILEMIAQNEVSEWGKGVGVTSHPTPLIAPAPALVISARSHQSMGARRGGGQRGGGTEPSIVISLLKNLIKEI